MNKNCTCPPDWSRFFKAACDPQRQTILDLIQTGTRKNVTEIVKELELSQSTVSHHLKVMVDAGLLSVEKSGKESIYSICPDKIQQCCSGFIARFAAEDVA